MPVFVEKNDEPELIERYEVAYFPAFVWTDGSGNEIARAGQPADTEELLEAVELAVEELALVGTSED